MIFTSSYDNWKTKKYRTYSISGDRGKGAGYEGNAYPALAPKLDFWKVWHDNIGKLSEEENTKYYVEQYYNKVLRKLDPEKVFKKLDNSVLLCYEKDGEFCHRHIVSAWFKILLDEDIREVKIEDGKVKPGKIYLGVRKYLEEAMRNNRQMYGFTSLRALYLYEKGVEVEREADRLVMITGKDFDNFRSQAISLREEAHKVERDYKVKVKK